MSRERYDAVVVGSGPNGLSAATHLAREGRAVLVVEAADTLGGGARTAELTLPGFRHDVCSAVHPMGVGSPFLSRLPLADHGLRWVHPDVPVAHPLDGGRAALCSRSLDETAGRLGGDGRAWRGLFGPLVRHWEALAHQFLGPLGLPRHPLPVARFGLSAVRSARALAESRFSHDPARALLAGMSGHSFLRLDRPTSASFGLVLGIAAHTGGWPMPEGGAQAITDALVSYLTSLGVEVVTGWPVSSLADLPPSPLVLLDTAPAEAVRILGHHMAPLRRVQLGRFRHGLGVFKVDYALSEPVPWAAQEVSRAGTVHVGGTLAEIAAAEDEVTRGRHASRPFVLVVQPSLFDSTRAPAGRHTLWAYCHVPNGSAVDMTTPIEHQIERFAPGFGDIVLARHTTDTAQMQASNRNHVGGDISGGANDGLQLLFRPRLALDPYFLGAGDGRTVYLCSASTPPGGGVHGMCGFHAARLALRRLRPR